MAGSSNVPSGISALFESKAISERITHLGTKITSPVKKMLEGSVDTSCRGYKSVTKQWSTGEIYAGGFRAAGENRASDRPATSSATTRTALDFNVLKPEVYPARWHQILTFHESDLSLKNGSSSAAAAINHKIERAMEGKAREDARIVFGDGSGRLGTVVLTSTSGGTGSTVDFMRDDQTNYYWPGFPGARFLFPGRPIVFVRGTAAVASSYAHIVDSVQPYVSDTAAFAGTPTVRVDRVTLTAALNAAVADYDIAVAGDYNGNAYNDEPLGLDAWIDDGRRVPTICGISRLTNKRAGTLAGNIYTTSTAQGNAGHFQNWDEVMLWKVISNAARTSGATRFDVVMNSEVWANLIYEAELYGGSAATTPFRARLNQSMGAGTGDFRMGVESFKFTHPDLPGGMEFTTDYWAPFSTVLGFDKGDYTCLSWDDFAQEKGWGAASMPNAYHYDFQTGLVGVTYKETKNYFCERPDKSFRIERLRNFAAPATRVID